MKLLKNICFSLCLLCYCSFNISAQSIQKKECDICNNSFIAINDSTIFPWNMNMSKLSKYGSFKIKKRFWYAEVIWDSIKIFNLFSSKLYIATRKKVLGKNKISKIVSFNLILNQDEGNLVKDYLLQCSGFNGKPKYLEKTNIWRWYLATCKVNLAVDKSVYYMEFSRL